MLLNRSERSIIETVIEYYKSHFMDLKKLSDTIINAPNLNNLRFLVKNASDSVEADDEYQRALELVEHLKTECPNVSVVVNCGINTTVFQPNTGPYHLIGKDNTLLSDPNTMFQPLTNGKTKMIFRYNLLDKSLGTGE